MHNTAGLHGLLCSCVRAASLIDAGEVQPPRCMSCWEGTSPCAAL